MKVYIGIDPGVSGGLAALCQSGAAFKTMPDEEVGVWEWLATYSGKNTAVEPCEVRAVIEEVSGYVGGPGQPGSAMFLFGQSYGGLRMALVGNDIPFEAVRPQAWQKALGISSRKKSENKVQWKGRLKREAEKLFPDLLITLATADALLIAHYCRLTHGG